MAWKARMPTFVPTANDRNKVVALMIAGVKKRELHKYICNPRTGKCLSASAFLKHFSPELEFGRISMDARVVHKIFDECMEGNSTLLKFWAECRLGWKPPAADLNVAATVELTDARARIAAKVEQIRSRMLSGPINGGDPGITITAHTNGSGSS